MIKAVVFDLDDTLYNEKDFVFGGFKEVSIYLSQNFNINQDKIYNRMIDILNKIGRGKIFDIVCEENKININIDTLTDIYRNTKPKLKLPEESISVLSKLRSCGYKIGVITDGMSSVQWIKIKQLDLENYVDKIIVTDDFGSDYWKPNKYAYIEIVKYFNINPYEAIYIGDNSTKDFIGAKEVGFKTLRIKNKYSEYVDLDLGEEYEADAQICNLHSIFNFLN